MKYPTHLTTWDKDVVTLADLALQLIARAGMYRPDVVRAAADYVERETLDEPGGKELAEAMRKAAAEEG